MAWMSRRTALILGGTAALVAAFPAPLAAARVALPPVARRLLRIFRDPDAAADLGHRVLELASIELTLLEDDRVQRTAGDAELHRAIRAFMSEDFTAGRTVRLDGWIISRTEAELFCIAALARRQGASS